MPRWLLYTLISILFWGVWGVVSKVSSTTVSAMHTQVLFAVGMIPPVLLAAVLPGRSEGTDKRRGIVYGFLTGIIGGIGNLALFRAFEIGADASVISPLTGIYPLFTVIASVIVLKERMNGVQIAGTLLAGTAIFLLSSTEDSQSGASRTALNDWTLLAIATLVLWGFTGLTQKLSTNSVSAEISFISFAAAMGVISIVILAAYPMRWDLPPIGWFWAILAGAIHGFGTLASFGAYRVGGKASVVTPLAALYPVITAFLAVLFLAEHLKLRALIGIGFAIAAAIALSWETPAKQTQPEAVTADSAP